MAAALQTNTTLRQAGWLMRRWGKTDRPTSHANSREGCSKSPCTKWQAKGTASAKPAANWSTHKGMHSFGLVSFQSGKGREKLELRAELRVSRERPHRYLEHLMALGGNQVCRWVIFSCGASLCLGAKITKKKNPKTKVKYSNVLPTLAVRVSPLRFETQILSIQNIYAQLIYTKHKS